MDVVSSIVMSVTKAGLTGIVLLGLLGACKTPETSSSEVQSVFRKTAGGAEVVYDLSECIARKAVNDFAVAFDNALVLVSDEVKKRIKKNTNIRDAALTHLDSYRYQIDFSGVTKTASDYIEANKAEIYGTTGFRMASLVPTGYVLAFYHPLLDNIDLSLITGRLMQGGTTVSVFPYIGIVVVPTCYQTIEADGVSALKMRYRFGATYIGMWRLKSAEKPNENPGAAPQPKPSAALDKTSAEFGKAWHVTFGFVWGGLYDPNQLRGPLLGLGGAMTRSGKSVSTKNTKIASKKAGHPDIGVVLRPMALWGYSDPKRSKRWNVGEVFNSIVGNFWNSNPTHFALYFDIIGSQTQKSYLYPYVGLQITSSEIIESFIERPVIVEEGANGVVSYKSPAAEEEPSDAAEAASQANE